MTQCLDFSCALPAQVAAHPAPGPVLSAAAQAAPVIDFFHDVVCGWCYVMSPRLRQVAREESCELTVLGTFTDSGRMVVRHSGTTHADLDLQFLHQGLPVRTLQATYKPPTVSEPLLPPETWPSGPDEPPSGTEKELARSDENVPSALN